MSRGIQTLETTKGKKTDYYSSVPSEGMQPYGLILGIWPPEYIRGQMKVVLRP